jgi:hypothetical protein
LEKTGSFMKIRPLPEPEPGSIAMLKDLELNTYPPLLVEFGPTCEKVNVLWGKPEMEVTV